MESTSWKLRILTNSASTIEQTLETWQLTDLCFGKIGDCSWGKKNAVSGFRGSITLFSCVKTAGIFATLDAPPRAFFIGL